MIFCNLSIFSNLLGKIKSNRFYYCYSRILPYFKPYAFRAVLAVGLCIPIGGLDAVIAMALKPYTDLVMIEKSANAAWYIPFAIVLFAVVQGGLNYLVTYLNSYVGEKVTRDLKFELFKKLLSYDSAYFDKTYSGNIVFEFNNQADAACAGLLAKMKMLISRIFSSISLIGVLIYNSWQLSIIAIIILGSAFLPISKIRHKIQKAVSKVTKGSSRLVTEYTESYAGNKTISAYNLHNYQQSKFLKVLNAVTGIRIKLTQKTAWLSPIMHVIVSIGMGISIAYGSHLIVSGQISSGNFVAFLTALIMLYNPVKNMGNNIRDFQMSMQAVEQVLALLNTTSNIQDSPNPIKLKEFQDKIQFDNVTFEYIADHPVLTNLNLEIKKGETIALVGNSGGGKSTIASLLPRFYDVKSGSIKIDGIDIRDYSLKSLRDNIAIVFQDNFLFSGSIRENVILGYPKASQKEIERAVEMAYLDEFVSTLEKGLETEIGERGILLSGGQKQRVAIARAFLKNSPILILDEATSALDNRSEAIVQRAIENLMINKTVIIIAHRLSTIKNATKIAFIENGSLVELGSHDELLKIKDGKYKALYDMQFRK